MGAGRPRRLLARAQFLRVAKGRRVGCELFTLQLAPREDAEGPRFGLTVTKKEGRAVERNRMRRRLREALRLASPLPARADHDYVLVARRALLAAPFGTIAGELARVLERSAAEPRATSRGHVRAPR